MAVKRGTSATKSGGKASKKRQSHLVRERSPFKNEMDRDDLDPKRWRRYAFECGRALAHALALADEDTGVGEGSVEARILDAAELVRRRHGALLARGGEAGGARPRALL